MRPKRRPTEIPHIPEHARIAHRFPRRPEAARGVQAPAWLAWVGRLVWWWDRLSWRKKGNVGGLAVVALVMAIDALVGKEEDPTIPDVVAVAPVERMATSDAPTSLASSNEAFSDVAVVPAQAELAGVFTSDDYPSSALRNEEEGTVRARVDVAADGRATECMVVATSGHASLDEVTCRLLIERGRFTPALNARGEPIASSVTIPAVRWEIP